MDAVARLLVWLDLFTLSRSNSGQTDMSPIRKGSRLLVVKERAERRVKMREARREICLRCVAGEVGGRR